MVLYFTPIPFCTKVSLFGYNKKSHKQEIVCVAFYYVKRRDKNGKQKFKRFRKV